MRAYCSLFVDAGYLMAAASTRVTGTSLRSATDMDVPGLLDDLQARVQVFNVLNHPSFALSNGNVFSTTGTTVATTTPGYARPGDPNFLAASTLFSGGFRSMTLGLKFVF